MKTIKAIILSTIISILGLGCGRSGITDFHIVKEGEATTQVIEQHLDTIPPTIELIQPQDGESKASRFLVKGTAHDNLALESVLVRIDDSDWNIATGAENWFYYIPTPLTGGIHTLTVKARDAAGNESEEISINVVIDPDIPTSRIITPPDNMYTFETDIYLTGDATDNVDLEYIKVCYKPYGTDCDTTDWQDADCGGSACNPSEALGGSSDGVDSPYEWTYTFSGLTEGEYAVRTKAIDNNGKESEIYEIKYIVDLTDPTLDTINSTISGTSAKVQGTASDNFAILRIMIKCDSSDDYHIAQGTNTWEYTCNYTSSGTKTICAYVIDKAGNESTETCQIINIP